MHTGLPSSAASPSLILPSRGLWPVEIVGEALAPVRDQVVIATKSGWDIDLETGKHLGRLNSRPDHIKVATEGMLKGSRPIA